MGQEGPQSPIFRPEKGGDRFGEGSDVRMDQAHEYSGWPEEERGDRSDGLVRLELAGHLDGLWLILHAEIGRHTFLAGFAGNRRFLLRIWRLNFRHGITSRRLDALLASYENSLAELLSARANTSKFARNR